MASKKTTSKKPNSKKVESQKPESKKSDIRAKVEQILKKSRLRRAAKSDDAQPSKQGATVTENRLELLITTVNRSKAEYYIDLLQSFEVNLQFVTLGHGTADAKMRALFGLDDSDKTVIFSVIQGNKLKDALETLDNKFRTIKNGKGVAYTVPLSSMIGTLLFGFLSNNRMAVKDDKETK